MADHYDSAEEAAEGARQMLAPQYAPFGKEPRVLTVEAAGLKVVCVPWGHTKFKAAIGRVGSLDTTAGKLAFAEARAVDTIWWIEGQREPGRIAALKHARALADLGDEYTNLMYEIAGACMAQEAGPGAPAQ